MTITATPSLGSWSASNANASVGAFTGVVTGVNAGTVNISYHYTDANNCTDDDVHPMTVDPAPDGRCNIRAYNYVDRCAGYQYFFDKQIFGRHIGHMEQLCTGSRNYRSDYR